MEHPFTISGHSAWLAARVNCDPTSIMIRDRASDFSEAFPALCRL